MDVGAGREPSQMTSSCQRRGDVAVNVRCRARSHRIGVGQSDRADRLWFAFRLRRKWSDACSANLVEDAPPDGLTDDG